MTIHFYAKDDEDNDEKDNDYDDDYDDIKLRTMMTIFNYQELMANSAAACQRACEIENEFLCRFLTSYQSYTFG